MCAFLASPRSQTGKAMGRIEAAIEWIIFNSRWTLTPIYLGLVAALVLLVRPCTPYTSPLVPAALP